MNCCLYIPYACKQAKSSSRSRRCRIAATWGALPVGLALSVALFCHDASAAGTIGGTISADTTLYATNSPYTVSSTVTINSGVTLTVQPGVTLLFNSSVSLSVSSGGRLLAEGNATNGILFTRSGTNGGWGHITVAGAVGTPETRIAYARLEYNTSGSWEPCIDVPAGTVYLDHLSFGNPSLPYLHVDGASFIVQNCVFRRLKVVSADIH